MIGGSFGSVHKLRGVSRTPAVFSGENFLRAIACWAVSERRKRSGHGELVAARRRVRRASTAQRFEQGSSENGGGGEEIQHF